MSSFNEFSKHANHGDLNRMDSKKKVKPEDIAKNRIDPNTGNEREDRGPSYQENSNPRSSSGNKERSQDRNER